jgi:hypothetical protein
MDDTTNIDDKLGRDHKTGADHYRTADMHRTCALALLRDAKNTEDAQANGESVDGADPWKLLEKFDHHMQLAGMHARLADVRIGAVQLLQRHLVDDEQRVTRRQRVAVEEELNAWADTIAPL